MSHVRVPQSICLFGLGYCDITPPVGMYHRMWGAATHDRATGIHRPLTATALCFKALGPQADAERIVLAVDHCLLWNEEMEDLLAKIATASGLRREQIAVTFSHTHAAGLMGRERQAFPGGELIGPYLDTLNARLATLVCQARQQLQPVTITYGIGRCDLAAQRDFWDADSQQFVCGFNPAGVADDTVLVARVTADKGSLLATIVNYACHPTSLAWQNTLISPDFPGALREMVQQATGLPCVFLQGASGDVGPRQGFVGDVAVADRNGRQLAFAVLSTLEGMPPPRSRFVYTGPVLSGATIGTWEYQPLTDAELLPCQQWHVKRWTVDLAYRTDLPNLEQTARDRERWQGEEQAALAKGDAAKARDCRAMVERMNRLLVRLSSLPPGQHFPFVVNLWRMGEAFWLTVEGEFYNIFQRALRQRFPHVPIIVATLTNGWRPGYLPTADTYGKGIYQESIAVVAPGSLEKMIQAVGDQIQQLV